MKTLLKTPILLLFFAQCAAAAVVGFSVEPRTAEIALKLSVKKGWHIYGKSAQTGSPTVFDFSLPKGFRLDSLEWQPEKTFEFMGAKFGGYDGEVLVKAKISASENTDTPKNFSAKVSASWLACSDTCVPESASADFGLLQIPAEKSAEISETGGAIAGFFAVLAAAFSGGLILNLMPCVLPVLGIKIISFAKSANGSRAAAILNALCYAGGIVATFLLLAVILLVLRSGGESLGWGFQLQNPIFSSIMALLFFAMALSFAGVFEIGAGLTGFAGVGGRVANKYAQAALSGVLAVLVASPCTAPFMGSALGVALSGGVSAFESLAVFAFLGLGMASPYVVLAAVPNAKKYLPKAGAWTERLKQILSIPLFATVAWLVWIYDRQTGSLGHILAALAVAAAGGGRLPVRVGDEWGKRKNARCGKCVECRKSRKTPRRRQERVCGFHRGVVPYLPVQQEHFILAENRKTLCRKRRKNTRGRLDEQKRDNRERTRKIRARGSAVEPAISAERRSRCAARVAYRTGGYRSG